MKYSFGWRGQREAQGRPMKTMTWILFLGIVLGFVRSYPPDTLWATIFHSFLVLITDTWLHFTTKTINFTQVGPNTTSLDLSFGLLPQCTNLKTPFTGGCTLNPAAANTFLLSGATALKVLGNISDTILVKTFTTKNDQFAYLGNTPQAQLASIDYTAHSWAVQSHCTPVMSKCIDADRASGPGAPFNCPFAFQGYISTTYENALLMAYFTDSSGSDNATQFGGIGQSILLRRCC
jgi:hypothetical protein